MVCFVMTVITNVGISVCVLRFREMRTPINLCLVNLAAADLLFAIGMPGVAITRITQSWMLGDAVCRILPYSQVIINIYSCFIEQNINFTYDIVRVRFRFTLDADNYFYGSSSLSGRSALSQPIDNWSGLGGQFFDLVRGSCALFARCFLVSA